MTFFQDAPIRRKLMIIGLSATALALLLASMVMLVTLFFSVRHSLVNDLFVTARMIGNNSTAALSFNDLQNGEEVLSALKADSKIVRATIYRPDGSLFAGYQREAGDKGDLVRLRPRGEGYYFQGGGLAVSQDIALDGRKIGSIVVESDLRDVYGLLTRFSAVALIVIILPLFVSYIMLSRLRHAITDPINDLVCLMRDVSEKKTYSVRAAIKGDDELGALAAGFNGMLANIQERDNELELHRRHLEELVTRRTSELALAYDQIQQELTERTRAEEALRRSEASLSNAQRMAHIGNWDWDIAGDALRWSDEIYRIFGLTPAGFSGTYEAFLGFVHPDDLQTVKKSVEDALYRQKPYSIDHRIVLQDGSERTVHEQGEVLFDGRGRPLRMSGTVQDITQQRILEAQLRQAQKMEAIGTLAGGIAHDFNNILSAIIGYGHLLEMKMPGDDPLRAFVDPILGAADKAANLTQSLLAFSRKQIINPKPVDMNDIIRKVEKFLRRLIGEDIELTADLGPGKLTVMADYGQIEQVLMNLVTNARDAMPEGGVLTITSKAVVIDDHFIREHGYGVAGLYASVSVCDTGAGMDAKTKEKIFEPFFTTKEQGRGTGLGLAIVYGIIKQHNGYIHVSSEPGIGTTFRIYLPVIASETDEAGRAASESPVGGTETILLAEDDSGVRSLNRKVLQEFGYTVLEAVDGEDAIEKFRNNRDRIQFLILDVIMPKKNGKEAYDEIKKLAPDPGVLFLSGYTADIVHKKGILEAELPFIQKPVAPQVLLKKVREGIDSRSPK